MMRRTTVLVVLAMVCFAWASMGEGKWTIYTSGNQINALVSTGKYIWAGTNGGAVCWDTDMETYVKYTTTDGLASNSVNAVTVDNRGALWFGTDKGVSRFNGTSWTTFTTADGLISNIINAIAVDKKGNIWFGTGYGASMFDGASWKTYTEADGLSLQLG